MEFPSHFQAQQLDDTDLNDEDIFEHFDDEEYKGGD